MPDYIVCQKKRNNPRMDIRVCEKKCRLKEECKDYRAHQKTATHQEDILPAIASPPPELEAA